MSGSWTGGGGHGSAPAHSLPGPASGAAPTRIATLDPEQRYRRIGLLGEGGMGRVWLAWDERLARNVAVKEPAGPRAAAAAALLRHEALIAARLEHPGIVVVHDVIDADPPWFVMACVRGAPLAVQLTEHAPPALRTDLVRAVLEAAEATAHAHAGGIVHRDLSPGNLLLGDDGKARIIDWGVSGDRGAAVTSAQRVGTPSYIAPEAASAPTLEATLDVWALGAILCAVVHGTRTPPDAIDEHASPLDAIIAKATRTEPTARYADGGAIAADLRRWFDGQRVLAYEPRTTELVRQLLHRWRAWIRLGAAVALATSLAVGWGLERTAAEAERALRAERDARAAERIAQDQATAAAAALAASLAERSAEAEAGGDVRAARQASSQSLAITTIPLAVGVASVTASLPTIEPEEEIALPECDGRWHTGDGTPPWICRDDTGFAAWDGSAWRWRRDADVRTLRIIDDRVYALGGRVPLVTFDLHTGAMLAKNPALGVFASERGRVRLAADASRVLDLPIEPEVCRAGFNHVLQLDAHTFVVACLGGGALHVDVQTGERGPVVYPDEVFDAVVPGWGATRSGVLLPLDQRDAGIVIGEPVLALDLLPNPNLLLVTTLQQEVKVLDLVQRAVVLALEGRPHAVGIQPDGTITTLEYGRLRRWRPAAQQPITRYQVGHGITAIAWLPDSATLVVGDGGGGLHRIKPSTGEAQSIALSDAFMLKDLSIDPDDDALVWVISARNASILGVDVDTLTERRRLVFRAGRRITRLHGGVFLAPSYGRHLERWTNDAIEQREPVLERVDVFDVERSADGTSAVVVSDAGAWRVGARGPAEPLIGPGDWRSGALASDGGVALGGPDRVTLLGASGLSWPHPSYVVDLAFSPDGQLLATGGFDGWVRVWETATGRLVSEHRTHRERVAEVAFSPNGRWLASASWDGEVRIADARVIASAAVPGVPRDR